MSNAATRRALPCSIQLFAARQGDTALLTLNSDEQGRYSIPLAGLQLQRFFRLVFSSPGFAPRTVVADRDRLPQYLRVSLKSDPSARKELLVDEGVHVTGGIEPLLDRPERYDVSGGPLPQMQVDGSRVRQGFWRRCRAAVRRFFERRR